MSNIQNRIIQQDADPFTMVPNEIITEPDLSNNAKIIWAYLRMRPHDWTFYNCEILKHIKLSAKTLVKTFKELEEFGLIIRTQLRTINRQTLDDTESPPTTQKRLTVKPITVKSPLLIKKQTKKDITNISPAKKSKSKSKLPTLAQIKKECEREIYYIDEEKFFKWCQKHGDLNSPWKTILMNWSSDPKNQLSPTQIAVKIKEKDINPEVIIKSRLANFERIISGSFEVSNGMKSLNDWKMEHFEIKEKGKVTYSYDNKNFLQEWRNTIERLTNNGVEFKEI